MFVKKTVFILGAGASIPYGLPSGAELVRQIIEKLAGPSNANNAVILSQIHKASGNPQLERDALEDFRKTLEESREQSIDAFLQNHMQFEPQAKRAIAAMILMGEVKKSIVRPSGDFNHMDWHPLLLPMLNASYEDFHRNSVGFITYNYDRSLEEFLFGAFKSREAGKRSEDDWAKRLKECIPIFHLHGQVGQHKAFADNQANVVKYGDSWMADNIRTAS